MIAKITKGKSPQAIGRYLHGPGHANEHDYSEDAYGVVIGGSMAKEGDRDAAPDLDHLGCFCRVEFVFVLVMDGLVGGLGTLRGVVL